MTQYDNTNRGVLFANDKEGNESRPDWRGKIDINGTEFWLSAWVKESKAGEEFLSLVVQPKQARDQGGARGPSAPNAKPSAWPQQSRKESAPPQEDFDDDIPF